MSAQVTNYQCPACYGPLQFDAATGKLGCEYCGSAFTVAEIEALYAEKEAQAAQNMAQADAKQEQAQADTHHRQNANRNDPCFSLHGRSPRIRSRTAQRLG